MECWGEIMADYLLYADSGIPDIFKNLYEILQKAKNADVFPFRQYSLCFRCRRCEDVIEMRIKNIRVLYFYQDYLRLDFDKESIWLSPYDNIEDIWIEKFEFLEDEQMTLLDDYDM